MDESCTYNVEVSLGSPEMMTTDDESCVAYHLDGRAGEREDNKTPVSCSW
jgi:hypothetical protein